MLKRILGVGLQKIVNSKEADTIYALATGVNTAVSIVRVGGNQAFRTLQLLSKTPPNPPTSNPIRTQLLTAHKIQPQKAHLKKIYNSQGNIIDQGLILYFPPNHSYNNEQIIELHVHGSRAVVSSIFRELKAKGFRMADRGEFTKRAVLNGKINLVQAESINDLIRSQSQFQRRVAINNMLGKSREFLDGVKQELIKCLANHEAFIDFQEDQKDVKADLIDTTKQKTQKILQNLLKIAKNYKNLQIVKQGIDITILGKPNSGKSTLINTLSQKQVSIVSEQPGTTRDILQTQIQCGGVMVNLYDTAGLRDTEDRIEREGVKRAKIKMKESQINLLLIDLDQEKVIQHVNKNGNEQIQYEIVNENSQLKQTISAYNYNEIIDKNTIIVINKSDKFDNQTRKNAKYFIKVQKMRQNEQETQQNQQSIQQKCYADLIISSQNENSVSKLVQFLSARIQKQFSLYQSSQQIYFTRERYFIKLQKCSQLLNRYIQQSRPDIACEYLRASIQQITQIFGKVDVEDVLDVLFKEFCIGK